MCVRVCVCVYVCMCVYMCMCMCTCVCACDINVNHINRNDTTGAVDIYNNTMHRYIHLLSMHNNISVCGD